MVTTKTRKSNGTGALDQEGATSKRLIAERLVATEICGIPTVYQYKKITTQKSPLGIIRTKNSPSRQATQSLSIQSYYAGTPLIQISHADKPHRSYQFKSHAGELHKYYQFKGT